jgi:hypothetical protein
VAVAGYTALHYAVTWEAIDTIQTLIKVRARFGDAELGNASLTWLVVSQGGASVNALTRDNIYYLNGSIPMVMVGGRTALHLAAEKVRIQISAGYGAIILLTTMAHAHRGMWSVCNCSSRAEWTPS